LSLGGCEVNVEEWGIDAAIGGLQKCLGGPPGLALVALSERAQKSLERRTRPHSAYLDLRAPPERSTSMLYAAREALRLVLDEGLESRWQRHRQASRVLRAGLDAMGLERFVTSDDSAPMITLVTVPDGVDEAEARQQLLIEHGIEIMAAFGPLRGRVWRIGTMGTNARLPSVLAVLSALETVLASRGMQVPRGAAVDAATRLSRQPL
jgi:aspartate aminotransferase-like enzyme